MSQQQGPGGTCNRKGGPPSTSHLNLHSLHTLHTVCYGIAVERPVQGLTTGVLPRQMPRRYASWDIPLAPVRLGQCCCMLCGTSCSGTQSMAGEAGCAQTKCCSYN